MDVQMLIAENIKRIRNQENMSVDQLATVSGVSRSMLAQIERGEANPSINTVWKIANGLKVPFDALTIMPKRNMKLIRLDELMPIYEADNKVMTYSMFPDDENRKFSVYYVEVEPMAVWGSNGHAQGTSELIFVQSGELTVTVHDENITIKVNEAFRFKAETDHTYANLGKTKTILMMIMYHV